MSLPNSYSSIIPLKPEIEYSDALAKEVISKLEQEEGIKRADSEKASFYTKNSMFRLEYTVVLGHYPKEKAALRYEIQLSLLFYITLGLILVIGLLGGYSVASFFLFSVSFGLLFFFLNFLIVAGATKKAITRALRELGYIREIDHFSDNSEIGEDETEVIYEVRK